METDKILYTLLQYLMIRQTIFSPLKIVSNTLKVVAFTKSQNSVDFSIQICTFSKNSKFLFLVEIFNTKLLGRFAPIHPN